MKATTGYNYMSLHVKRFSRQATCSTKNAKKVELSADQREKKGSAITDAIAIVKSLLWSFLWPHINAPMHWKVPGQAWLRF